MKRKSKLFFFDEDDDLGKYNPEYLPNEEGIEDDYNDMMAESYEELINNEEDDEEESLY